MLNKIIAVCEPLLVRFVLQMSEIQNCCYWTVLVMMLFRSELNDFSLSWYIKRHHNEEAVE